jgi:type VII secretion-associated serine protease mycosin
MSRNVFVALGAVASAVGLTVIAGGAVGPVPALAAAASPSVRAARVAAPSALAWPGPSAKRMTRSPQTPVKRASLTSADSTSANPTPVTPTSTSPQTACGGNPLDFTETTTEVTSSPWAQNALDFSAVWPLTMGQGQTVAVIDSGVNYVPQLAGRVSAIDETGGGITDCVGHGTAVAGIIAASYEPDQTAFAGVAPEADILSVKVSSSIRTNAISPQLSGDSDTLSNGIIDAVNDHATVLSISITTTNTTKLANAVQYAESHNVVVVAAGGNDEAGQPVGPFYPASYPGVISVGALNPDGSLASFADPHTQESVTAPGVGITSTEPGGYNNQLAGTSFATPFVSGVAALVRSEDPLMSEAQVVARIEATADGPTTALTGNGMVNPLQAVQAVLPNPNASSAPGNLQPVSVSRPVPPDQGTIHAAMGITAGAVAAAAVVTIAGVSISQSRRRRRRGPGAQPPEATVPSDVGLADSPLWE